MSSGNFQKAFLNNFTIFITLKENKIILHHLLGLDFCEFDNFLFLDLSLTCHEALINLFPHLHELNLAATAVTHLKISKKTVMQLKSYF